MQYSIKINDDVCSRQAANLVFRLSDLKGYVYIIKDNRMINAKSIIGVLSLGLKKGDIVEISCKEDIYKIDEIFKEVIG